MKKFLLSLLVLGSALAGQAQAANDEPTAVLQHGDQASVFTGPSAFVAAHANAVDGDVITLSAGTFTPTTITKKISVYGAGFEQVDETGTDLTKLDAGFVITAESDVLLEGIYVDGNLDINSLQMENLTINRCQIGDIRANNVNNSQINQSVVFGISVHQNTRAYATNFHISNSRIYFVYNWFSGSTIYVDHCLLSGGFYEDESNYLNSYTYTNCIFTYNSTTQHMYTGKLAQMINCIYVSANKVHPQAIVTNCYEVALADIFTDGENAAYSPERTWELQQPDVWVGTDGTPIGPSGGMGWNKVPTTPVVKNLQLNVSGRTLNVNYEADPR